MNDFADLPDDPQKIRQGAQLLRDAADEEDPGALIKAARQYLDWTQAELGRALGLSIHTPASGQPQCDTLGTWENGQHSPNWSSRSQMLDVADGLEERADEADKG
jgi:transcriptional regulator with XRE-family HTH domain